MNTNIILFEDQFVDDMRPISLTKPVFGVTCAVYRLHDIARFVTPNVSSIVRDYLEPTIDHDYPCAPPADGPTLYLNAAVVPDIRYVEKLKALLDAGKPFLCTSGQRVAAAMLSEGAALPDSPTTETLTAALLKANLPLDEADHFATFDYAFNVVAGLYDLFEANLAHKIANGDYEEIKEDVFVGKDVEIAESAVFKPTDGPILLDDGVKVLDFTYFTGPVYVGPQSRVIERSSVKDYVSIGHTCKIGGEVEASTIEHHSNKQHHGFLGHAYVGSWVNMGAGTSNSDLKNTYGKVRVVHQGKRIDTDMQFFGCIIGDLAKTAINTSIFTGKFIGVSSMLYGFVGQNVASFCNYAKSFGQITECPLEQALISQKRMFARRGIEQTQADIDLLTEVFELTRKERLISAELPVL
jgi:UDP-N-acetylglucosamine diphosphorylase/glucosamine-1-phosphate N-acetyltransferase